MLQSPVPTPIILYTEFGKLVLPPSCPECGSEKGQIKKGPREVHGFTSIEHRMAQKGPQSSLPRVRVQKMLCKACSRNYTHGPVPWALGARFSSRSPTGAWPRVAALYRYATEPETLVTKLAKDFHVPRPTFYGWIDSWRGWPRQLRRQALLAYRQSLDLSARQLVSPTGELGRMDRKAWEAWDEESTRIGKARVPVNVGIGPKVPITKILAQLEERLARGATPPGR